MELSPAELQAALNLLLAERVVDARLAGFEHVPAVFFAEVESEKPVIIVSTISMLRTRYELSAALGLFLSACNDDFEHICFA